MPSFPLLTKLESRPACGQLNCAVSTGPRRVPPVNFALSKVSSDLNLTNSDILYNSPYKFILPLRSRQPAKVSTVSLVGRKDQKETKRSRVAVPKKEPVIRNETNYTSLCECLESRPPLQIDFSRPNPTTYDPPTYLPWETTSPSFTIRPKTQPEKECGGDRVAWNKQWFASHDIWTYRAHFDERYPWPSPAHYTAKGTVGGNQMCLPQSPAHSIGKRRELVLSKKDSENEPSPNQYNYSSSKLKLMNNFPSYTIQEGRRGGTFVWRAREPVPGPGTYNPHYYRSSSRRCAPCFSMSRGVREMGITRNCTL